MRSRSFIAGGTALASLVTIIGVLATFTSDEPEMLRAPQTSVVSPGGAAGEPGRSAQERSLDPASGVAGEARRVPDAPAQLATVRADVGVDEEGFPDRMAWLLENSSSLSATERREGALRLESEITELESQGRLLPAQAIVLRASLLRLTAPSEEAFRAEADAMVRAADEQMDAERRAAEETLLAAHSDYRARELEIVREVSSSDGFPDEASRQAELRRRLRELRSEHYGSHQP